MSPSLDVRENRAFASELKFLIPCDKAEGIRTWVRACMAPDPHAAEAQGDIYQITSLYFDTAACDVFHRNGSYGRSKYRVRRYGASSLVFLERKLKTRGLVSKRRSAIPMPELLRLADEESRCDWPGRWYQRRLKARQLRPVCQISYTRMARVGSTNDGPIRLTMDEAVHAATAAELRLTENEIGVPVTPEQVIIEMKFRRDMPVLFKRLIEEFALDPQPVSKYRSAMRTLGLATEKKAPEGTAGNLVSERYA